MEVTAHESLAMEEYIVEFWSGFCSDLMDTAFYSRGPAILVPRPTSCAKGLQRRDGVFRAPDSVDAVLSQREYRHVLDLCCCFRLTGVDKDETSDFEPESCSRGTHQIRSGDVNRHSGPEAGLKQRMNGAVK